MHQNEGLLQFRPRLSVKVNSECDIPLKLRQKYFFFYIYLFFNDIFYGKS